jgi:hypothetical protein
MMASEFGTIEEAYKKGDHLAILVHGRKDGEVFFHTQAIGAAWVGFDKFRRTNEAAFDEAIMAEGCVPYDIEQLKKDTPNAA